MLNKNAAFTQGFLWLSAALSVAEIIAGMLLVSLGVRGGLLTILTGRTAGCILLFLAGLMGAEKKTAFLSNLSNILR